MCETWSLWAAASLKKFRTRDDHELQNKWSNLAMTNHWFVISHNHTDLNLTASHDKNLDHVQFWAPMPPSIFPLNLIFCTPPNIKSFDKVESSETISTKFHNNVLVISSWHNIVKRPINFYDKKLNSFFLYQYRSVTFCLHYTIYIFLQLQRY